MTVAAAVSTTFVAQIGVLGELDAAALTAAADALLSADGAAKSLAAGAAEQTAPRARGSRRRMPADLSPEQRAEREAMIGRHLALVRYVANGMSRHTGQSVLLEYDDLLSYGMEGLIAAVDTFDRDRGLKFSTWAVMHIRTTIQDALRTLDPLPRSLRTKGKEIDRVSAALAHADGRWPEVGEIAAALNQPVETLQRTLQDLSHSVVSLEAAEDGRGGGSTSGDDTGFSLLNLLADDDPDVSPAERLDRAETSRLLSEAIAALPTREEVLITAHYRQGQSMREVARLLGISESRVSQLHARAIRLLRQQMDAAVSIESIPHPQPAPPKLSRRVKRVTVGAGRSRAA